MKKKPLAKKYFFVLFFLTLLLLPFFSFAQTDNKFALTISPPLIKATLNPGDKQNYSIKLVNNNTETVKIYVSVADFKSNDQGGVEILANDQKENERYSLATWLEFSHDPIEIAPQETKEVPFTVNVPANAEPGGHYAALMNGTKPMDNVQGTGMKISSVLATLILLEVNGNYEESGEVKDFSTDKSMYDEPKVKFNVDFANTGNIHLQPRGEIKIYNYFNKEKDSIAINQNTEYGNVMPQSDRKWEFSWSEKKNFFDMGRYKAILFLSYGNKGQETVSRVVYFWVIYLKPLIGFTVAFFVVIILIILMIRRYIRKAVYKAQTNMGIVNPHVETKHKISVIAEENGNNNTTAYVKHNVKLHEPEPEGMSDSKKIFLASVLALAVVAGAVYYLYNQGILLNADKTNSETVNNQSSENVINSNNSDIEQSVNNVVDNSSSRSDNASSTASTTEENAGLNEETAASTTDEISEPVETATSTSGKPESASTTEESASTDKTDDKKNTVIRILNGSGVVGVAKQAESIVNQGGFTVKGTGNAKNYDYLNTVIQYQAGFENRANEISLLLPGQEEMQEIEGTDGSEIVIIIGSNFKIK